MDSGVAGLSCHVMGTSPTGACSPAHCVGEGGGRGRLGALRLDGMMDAGTVLGASVVPSGDSNPVGVLLLRSGTTYNGCIRYHFVFWDAINFVMSHVRDSICSYGSCLCVTLGHSSEFLAQCCLPPISCCWIVLTFAVLHDRFFCDRMYDTVGKLFYVCIVIVG